MPIETITVTITGANPQTKNVQVSVDPNAGTGSGTVTFAGTNGGFDAAQAKATIAGTAYTSNTANVAWQATNGIISMVDNVNLQGFSNPGSGTTWNGLGAAITSPQGPYNSVIINQVDNSVPITGLISPDGNSGEYKLVPPHINLITATGTAASPTVGTSIGYQGSFVTILKGEIVVKTAGTQTLYFLADDTWALYMGPDIATSQQPTRVNGTFTQGSLPATASGLSIPAPLGTGVASWPLLGCRNTSAAEQQPTDWCYINFPKPGVYPFVMVWVNNNDSQTYFQSTWLPGLAAQGAPGGGQYIPQLNANIFLPVALQAFPGGTSPAGNLQLSIANGNFHVTGDSVTLNVSVNGVHYPTKSYIPILEGTSGKIAIYNSVSSNLFTFPTYNGQAVDKPSAANAVFKLTGDNTAWQGRMSVIYDGTNFQLNYNGQALQSGIATSQLTITSEDIAWFDSANKSYDTYAATIGGGGNLYAIEVDYMVKPNPFVSSVTPTTIIADGGSHVFTLSLSKPLSPQQQGAFNTGNTVGLSTSWSGGVVTTSTAPNLDAGGNLLGWNITATVPVSSVNLSVTLNVTIQGNLTYLNGTTFTTGNVVYSSGNIATITLQGASLTPPVEYAFTVSPSVFTSSVLVTITATVYNQTNSSNTVTFLQRQAGTINQSNLGTTSTPISSSTGVVGGQTVFLKVYQLVVSSDVFLYFKFNLGFSCVDQNNLSMSPIYWSSVVYSVSTGGGGGGGCPELSMFVDTQTQVNGVKEGTTLKSLCGESLDYVTALPATEPAEVMQLEYSKEECFYLRTENAAEIIVSASTPVPTLEGLSAIVHGVDAAEVATYASQIGVGVNLITDVGNGPVWSKVEEIRSVGIKQVARLYCGGRNFAAGVKPGMYIYTHNVGPIIK